jgi:hypothetical protein
MTTDTNAGPVLPTPDGEARTAFGVRSVYLRQTMISYAHQFAEQVAGPLRERIAELELLVEQGGERHNGTWVAMLAECQARGSELDRLRAECESLRGLAKWASGRLLDAGDHTSAQEVLDKIDAARAAREEG